MAVEATIIPPERDKLSPVVVIVNDTRMSQIICRRISFDIQYYSTHSCVGSHIWAGTITKHQRRLHQSHRPLDFLDIINPIYPVAVVFFCPPAPPVPLRL